MAEPPSSRISGFHRHVLSERQDRLCRHFELTGEARAFLQGEVGLPLSDLDRMSENVVGAAVLPLSVALNFRVDGRDVPMPMAVEEPSIVAAASNAARLVRITGGFRGEADDAVMTAQVQLDDVPNPAAAAEALGLEKDRIVEVANAAIPRMVERGGGCRDAEVRLLDEELGMVVVHLYVDVQDAMGANLVDTVAEAVGPWVLDRVGGRLGLRILSNLPLRRMVRVSCRVSDDALGGEALADGIHRASRFAEKDIFRAVTHNKGIMNAVDAVAVAMGQDWRSIEAGAHAYAALGGRYGPLATWRRVDGGLDGRLEMPMAVATVGGSTRAHPAVRSAFELMRPSGAKELAVCLGAAGLACNLAALKALAGEGIQQGHMRLHRRKTEAAEARPASGQGEQEGPRRS
jgi:hydroxymethylglutaryl-CoA reductase